MKTSSALNANAQQGMIVKNIIEYESIFAWLHLQRTCVVTSNENNINDYNK